MSARQQASRRDDTNDGVDPEILRIIQALARANARRDYAAAELKAQERSQ